ncbi:MAG TPA: hypothetical protein VEZ90_18435, partial [Blastocatellia bacterium]|nr:hypothetical protein [Blastocatellia bacterium]
MGYYVRVLSSSEDRFPIRDIQAAIDANNLHAAVKVEVGSPDEWEQVVLCHDDGTEIALIERNAVGEGSLASEEL